MSTSSAGAPRPTRRRWLRGALVIADAFVALAAIGGGLALALGMESARFPLDWLAGTPFADYVAPGLLLALVVGGAAAVATAMTVRDARTGAVASVVAGAILVGWIAGEILVLTGDAEVVSPTEAFFLAVGLAIVALGAAVVRRERVGRDGPAARREGR
ncbi:MAG: hypothetical protein MUE82_11005 [Chloroflexi bacterium]|jgi:hypothetical protein|nr:hypothetical protein [Chloroflexota bacterium]